MSEESKNQINVDLSGQVAIVTGASQGIGKACALELARNGARVACLARNAEKLSDLSRVCCALFLQRDKK